MAKSLNLGAGSIRAWIAKGQDPKFEFFLDVCFRLDIAPVQLFLRSGTLPINRPRVIRKRPGGRAPALGKDDIELARQTIQKVLDNDRKIQKVADVAEQVGISPRQLLYHLPDEYSLVVSRVLEGRAMEKRERDAERIRTIERRAYSLTRRGIYPSQSKMLAVRKVRPSDLRVPLVWQRLRDIQDEFIEQHSEYKQDAKFMHVLRISRRRRPTRKEIADQIRLQSAHERLR
jgi:AraC-like DNA-binding protein